LLGRSSVCSIGSSGYFANFTREAGATRIRVKKETATDFLVGFDRWCVLAE
jgi:hypothetical protein